MSEKTQLISQAAGDIGWWMHIGNDVWMPEILEFSHHAARLSEVLQIWHGVYAWLWVGIVEGEHIEHSANKCAGYSSAVGHAPPH